MKKTLLVLVCAALLLAAGCHKTATPNTGSGINGKIVLGTSTLPCKVENGTTTCPTNTAFLKQNIAVEDNNNKTVAETATNANGIFSVKLQPGTYTLKIINSALTQQATVKANQYTAVEINFPLP